MKTIALIGNVEIDILHLVFSGLGLIFAGCLVWAINRAKTERLQLILELEHLQNTEETARTQRLRAEEAEKQLAAATALDAKAEERFQSLAQQVMTASQSQFMTLANETFAKHKEGAKGELSKLMEPIGENFAEFKKRVEAIEKVRAEDRSAIGEQIKSMASDLERNRTATSKLVTALSAPKGGGRWGEMTLRNVMEHAGLSAHCDFLEQSQTTDDDGKTLRPDVIIRLPGGREIVVDSKVSIDDYLKAVDEPDASKRTLHLKAHARNVKAHITKLSTKGYQSTVSERVDFVALFIPGENFYAAALEQMPDLMDYASSKQVIVTTPSTLLALAKAVSYGWRQDEATENAREAAELGRVLYERLVAMGTHIERVGKSLNTAVDSYNKMSRSLETRVLPSARKFQDLSIAPPDKSIPETARLDSRAALPDRTGELDFDEDAA
jgi:DNA recombination protein RmuC